MINLKLHKNELKLIKGSIETSMWLDYTRKPLCERVLKKIDKASTTPDSTKER